MFEFLMEKVFPVFLLILFIGLSLLLGEAAASEFPAGPGAVVGWGLAAALAMGATGALIGYFLADITFLGRIKHLRWIVTAACVFATLMPPTAKLVNGHSEAVFHRLMVTKVKPFALDYFDAIDANHDGTIMDDELEHAEQALTLTEDQGNLLRYMRSEQSVAGHVVHSYETTTYVWISTGDGGGYMSPITTTTYIYGITKADLAGFTERMFTRHSKW